jgi:hypothetical protein
VIDYPLLSEEISTVKEKVFRWLKEENFDPEEIANANANFAIKFRLTDTLGAFVVQESIRKDSLFVGTKFNFGKGILDLYKNMESKKKHRILMGFATNSS